MAEVSLQFTQAGIRRVPLGLWLLTQSSGAEQSETVAHLCLDDVDSLALLLRCWVGVPACCCLEEPRDGIAEARDEVGCWPQRVGMRSPDLLMCAEEQAHANERRDREINTLPCVDRRIRNFPLPVVRPTILIRPDTFFCGKIGHSGAY